MSLERQSLPPQASTQQLKKASERDILLTHGYFIYEDEKEKEIMKPHAPLGLMYISAYLKSKDWTVEVFDSTFADRQALYRHFAENPKGVIGIYTNLMTRPSIIEIAEYAHKYDWTVILGGPESANYPERYLKHAADFVVIGEGEQTLDELLSAIKNGADDFSEIAGIAYFDSKGSYVQTPAREMLKEIDDYPWPDREAINLQQYFDAWESHHGVSSVSMITARGCPYKCTWCSHAVFGYSHRRRDYKDCADELQHIVETYNPGEIWYADDVFTINHKWLFNYSAELKSRGLRVPFETISRADRMMNDKVMDTLAEMGCYRIWIGAESGSQRLLDHMKRGVTIEQVDKATKAAQERGIQVGMFLMWGYGDENLDDIDETVKQVANINPDIYFTTVAYPIKGTEFYNANVDIISSDKAWETASDRDLSLGTKKSDRYYRLANKYLHAHVDATRLAQSTQSNSGLAALKVKHARKARELLEMEANVSY